jgi:aromatic-L-amino-acid/L-tryptophan decarboxylase
MVDLRKDPAQIDGLSSAMMKVLPALEAFLEFKGLPDPARHRSVWLSKLTEPLPQKGQGAQAVWDALTKYYIPYGLRTGHPGFSGWISTMPPVVPAIAWFCGSIAGSQRWWVTPGNFIEHQSIRWLAQLHGLPDHFEGSLVAGGSAANLIGIACARQHAGEQRGLDASHGGWTLPEPRVYASDQVHHVSLRACGLLGLGRKALRRLPTNEKMKLDPNLLRKWIDDDIKKGCTPVAIVATAGDVNTGELDPIEDMRKIAAERNIWFHVDGSYGGFAILDERVRPLFGEFSKIDSLATDPHKWMNAPIGTGAAYVRDGALMQRTLALEPAPYYPPFPPKVEDVPSPFLAKGEGNPDLSVDQSSPGARGAAVWAILKEIGVDGLRERVKRHIDMAKHLAKRVRETKDWELLTEPTLSMCIYRYHPEGVNDEQKLMELNMKIFMDLAARARVVPSFTEVHGKFWLRPCWVGARNTMADADATMDESITVVKNFK